MSQALSSNKTLFQSHADDVFRLHELQPVGGTFWCAAMAVMAFALIMAIIFVAVMLVET
jgi:hypothetical protein